MKKIIIMLSAALLVVFTSCYKEDSSNSLPEEPKYNLKDDPNDPVQHFIYETYRDHGIIIITNPSAEDYVFDMTDKNNRIVFTPPKQEPAILKSGLDFIKKVYFDPYDKGFKRKNMPVVILMAEKIVNEAFGDIITVNSFVSKGFLAISNISEQTSNFTTQQISNYKSDINANFWTEYMGRIRRLYSIPDSFYDVSDTGRGSDGKNSFYGTYKSDMRFMSGDAYDPPKDGFWYEFGFVKLKSWSERIDPDDSSWDSYSYECPLKNEDSQAWINLLFTTAPSDVAALCEPHVRMKAKYVIIKQVLEDAGCDLSKMQ